MVTCGLDSHRDLEVRVKPLDRCHDGGSCSAGLTCIFTFRGISAQRTLVLNEVER